MPDMQADLIVEDHGSIALLQPLSNVGRGWIAENIVADAYQHVGGSAVVVEWRFLADIIEGARNDGVIVDDGRNIA